MRSGSLTKDWTFQALTGGHHKNENIFPFWCFRGNYFVIIFSRVRLKSRARFYIGSWLPYVSLSVMYFRRFIKNWLKKCLWVKSIVSKGNLKIDLQRKTRQFFYCDVNFLKKIVIIWKLHSINNAHEHLLNGQ